MFARSLEHIEAYDGWTDVYAEGYAAAIGMALNTGALDQAELALKKAYDLGGAQVTEAHLYLAGIYNKREKYGDASREFELYLKEAKGLKDKSQIKEMIAKLRAKEKSKQ